jgi:putative flippase GtrA
VAGVITSQVMLAILVGPVQLSAGLSGVLASMTAALVSYILSRWAWERKGRPDFLRETVPFWLVSAGVWLVLGLTSHYASEWAHSMGYTHWRRHLTVQGAYFLMNCVTFVARFIPQAGGGRRARACHCGRCRWHQPGHWPDWTAHRRFARPAPGSPPELTRRAATESPCLAMPARCRG